MSRIGYFVRETFISLRRNVMMTVSGIITIAICATIVTSSLLFIRGNDRAAAQQRAGVELEIFMKVGAAKGDVAALSDSLEEAKTQQQIRSFRYLDHKAAFQVYKNLPDIKEHPDLITGVKPEQLPESFRVTLTKADDVVIVAKQFATRPGVYSVITPAKQIQPYFKNVDKMRVVMLGAAGALLVASMFLVVMTVRLATFARRREIEVMKLVGASNLFVRVPFLAEGIVQGLIGGGIAFGLTFAARSLFNGFGAQGGALLVLKGFDLSSSDAMLLGTCGLIGSAVVGMLSAVIGLWRFLDT
jgi:cell division transport system permease protein